mgnify:FL=1
MINKCSLNDINRIKELGKLINNNFDKLNNIEDIINNNEIIGYYIDNVLIGFIIYKRLYDVTDLLYIVVDKIYRNKGIGSLLMEYLIKISERILLEVRCDNNNAIKLYKKYNFKIINIRKKYYDNMDAYVMELKV